MRAPMEMVSDPGNVMPNKAAQDIARNLNHLFGVYGGQLGIGPRTSDRIKYYQKINTGLVRTTIRAFLEGRGSNHPQSSTLDLLVHPFKRLLPKIQGNAL